MTGKKLYEQKNQKVDTAADERRKMRDALMSGVEVYVSPKGDVYGNSAIGAQSTNKRILEAKKETNNKQYFLNLKYDLWLVQFATKEIRECKEMAYKLIDINGSYLLQYPQYWEDKVLVCQALLSSPRVLDNLPETIRCDDSIKWFIDNQSTMNVEKISPPEILINEEWRQDSDKVLEFVESPFFQFWDDSYFLNEKIISRYLQVSRSIFLPYELVNQKKYVSILAKRHPNVLKLFPDYANDPEVILNAFCKMNSADENEFKFYIENVSCELLKNKEFALDMLRHKGEFFKFFTSFHNDSEVVREAMWSYIGKKRFVVGDNNEKKSKAEFPQDCPWRYCGEEIRNSIWGREIEKFLNRYHCEDEIRIPPFRYYDMKVTEENNFLLTMSS